MAYCLMVAGGGAVDEACGALSWEERERKWECEWASERAALRLPSLNDL